MMEENYLEELLSLDTDELNNKTSVERKQDAWRDAEL